jgi:hypothetical protein
VPSPSRTAAVAAVAALIVLGAVGAWLAATSLQQDFAAYFVAARARALGLDPYLNQVGSAVTPGLWDGVGVFAHSRFLYLPLVADLFRPLALLPFLAAKALFTAAALAALVAAALLGGRARIGLVAGALYYPVYLHLERGQIDLFVLVLLVAAWRHRGRPWLAGAALAAAAALKPALVGVLPVLVALGWRRQLAAAGGALALIAALTAAISGPALLREYLTAVLPRAAAYGEGGTEAMLLPEARLAGVSDRLGAGVAEIDGRRYRQSAWELPASASIPRLLAPAEPSAPAAALPYLAAAAGLVVAAAMVRRRGGGDVSHEVLFFGAAVACVVTSTTGWAMGLVWALPLVPIALRAPRSLLGVALLACACPPLAPGWSALAGAAVVVGAARSALAAAPSPGAAP